MFDALMSDPFVELGGEAVEIGVLGEMKRQVLPVDAAAGDFRDFRGSAARESDLEDISRIVVLAFRESVDLRGATVPGVRADLFGTMPITQRDVIDVLRQTGRNSRGAWKRQFYVVRSLPPSIQPV